MRGTFFIHWCLLLFIIAIFILFEDVHFHVTQYNLFLLLLIASTYILILCIWVLERRRIPGQEEDG